MPELLTQWPEQYDERIQLRIFDGLSAVPQVWRNYFKIFETKDYITYTTGYSGFGQMPRWNDGEPIPMDSPQSIFDFTITQISWGFGFKVSRNHVRYGKLSIIQRWADSLARSVAQTYASEHADFLSNAFTTSYYGGGSTALISASHASSGSATRSNINASAALTPANLETLIVQGLNQTNYRGLLDPISYNKLIIPPALRRTAVKILQSEGESGTANNDINTQRGMMSIIVDPPLTSGSTTAYFLQAANHGLVSFHGKYPTPKRYVEDNTESLFHGISCDFAVAAEHWEGICGSQGA